MRKLFWTLVLAQQLLFGYERIIALSPAINEILFALGAGKRVVANTAYCTYPDAAKDKPKVGGYFTPSLEKIVARNPDLVIMQKNNTKLAGQLRKLGINTEVIAIDSVASIRAAIGRIGVLSDREKRAQQLDAKIEKALGEIGGIIEKQKILIVIGHNTDLSRELYVAGQNLYFDDIINASGNRNALQSSRAGQPVINVEKVISLNPDIIIVLAPFMEQEGLSEAAVKAPWLALPVDAARRGNIFLEQGEYAGIPSHRVLRFIEDFKGFLDAAARP